MLTVVFGGAFDPPHLQHSALCAAAVKELGADRLVLVPTFLPPHKSEGFLSYTDRAALAKIAFGGLAKEVVVDDIEQTRQKDNYACMVLPLLNEKYGDIVYLLGGDSLEYLDAWYNPTEVLSACPIAVADRYGFKSVRESAAALKSKFGKGDFRFLNFVGEGVSSSDVKARLLLNMDVKCLSPDVSDYIRNNGLFRDFASTCEKVRSYENAELYDHTENVVLRGVNLNSAHNLKQDFKKVFLACLLHDNAKQRKEVEGLDVPADSIGTPVLHQFLGAEKAKRDFGITDVQILDAIRYHTTAKADMTVFEKLIYTADSTSYDRDYAPIPELRRIVDDNFEEGFKAVLRFTYEKLLSAGKPIYPLTLDAVNFYLLNK